jgi:ankyrin repeat protein
LSTTVTRLIEANAIIDLQYNNDNTQLIRGIIIFQLIYINLTNSLYIAIQNNKINISDYLIKNNANLNLQDRDNQTALILSIYKNYTIYQLL